MRTRCVTPDMDPNGSPVRMHRGSSGHARGVFQKCFGRAARVLLHSGSTPALLDHFWSTERIRASLRLEPCRVSHGQEKEAAAQAKQDAKRAATTTGGSSASTQLASLALGDMQLKVPVETFGLELAVIPSPHRDTSQGFKLAAIAAFSPEPGMNDEY